jgi:molecular chaperone GrpE
VRRRKSTEQPAASEGVPPETNGAGLKAGPLSEPDNEPNDDESTEDTKVEDLNQQLEECRAEADKYLDQLRRGAAEFSNYRKRVERDQAEAVKYQNAALLTRLLPMLDDLDTAFANLPADLNGVPWIAGMELIHRKLHSIFAAEGLREIETTGQVFNPTLHEAVTHEPTESLEEGQIIGEIRKGYRLNDKILRPAQVRVSSGKPESNS